MTTIHKGIYTCNLLLYFLERCNNRVYNKQLDKVALDPTVTRPMEKLKCIEWNFPNLDFLNKSNLTEEAQPNIEHVNVGNPSLEIPTL